MINDVANPTALRTTFAPLEIDERRTKYWHDLSLTDIGIARLERLHTHDAATMTHLKALAEELENHLAEHSPDEALITFTAAASDFHDAVDRLATIYTIEVLEWTRPGVGQHRGLRSERWPGWLDPDDPHRLKRVLTPLESGLIRISALARTPLQVVTIGLGEAGATPNELALLEPDSVDARSRCVLLPGDGGEISSRVAALPQWASDEIVRFAGQFSHREQLLYGGDEVEPNPIRSAICMNASNALKVAGPGRDRAVSFCSLRHTSARAIQETAGTDAAVEFLGESNYEAVREKIGLRPARPRTRGRRNAA